ncbi:hypothetical protein ENUP19_0057G0036 [Entamoeba nuttalli]|uniref:Palmitoyltransferase n=2 Tax=Entamoeba nuttalli TaxID=412467 RepID=K2HID9_ENTNP|nr:DHHC zinc finger domain containing protein [Entamoeba nuttalli P19]EKE42799.1 DHHC zinc finger domain containing protein [Entamoeba nuttalli P19]|eukprot:XP_008854869.1 DHHC zinc finger domain containing protein [Entamoeba nuttalli P19]
MDISNKSKPFCCLDVSQEGLKKLPVKVVFCLIGICYLAVNALIIFVLPFLYSLVTVIFWFIIAQGLVYLITYNYYQCHYVTAECIPKQYYQVDEEKKEEDQYCDICKRYKADRVHHCNVTNQCIYRYDHYCAMVGNSLGYHNYRYFFLFQFYLWVALLLADVHLYMIVVYVGSVCYSFFHLPLQ